MRAVTVLMVLLTLGCGDDDIPPPTFDAFVPMDGSPDADLFDGAVDGMDANLVDDARLVDDATFPDATLPDAPVGDTRPQIDVMPGGDVGFDICSLFPAGPTCVASSDCGEGTVCREVGCGMSRCVAAGRPCVADADCPSSGTCLGAPKGSCQNNVADTCSDSRECPLGFSCDLGTCTDRRVNCSQSSCPRGFGCTGFEANSLPICVPINAPCNNDQGCLLGESCIDVDGDNKLECAVPTSACTTNADCALGSCGIGGNYDNSCEGYGPCQTAADCISGRECRDLFGDGVTVCAEPGGCSNNAACPAKSVCATPQSGGPPTCISEELQ